MPSILMCVAVAACAMTAAPVPAPAPLPLIKANEIRVVPQTRSDITFSFSPVVKQAAPAVVNIYTKKIVQRRASPFVGDPFFERFFQDMFPKGSRTQRRIENSLGSGVILDASGIVVSNHHVVAGADQITVVLQDRREFQGRVIFADKESDLAVVQLENARDLPTLSLRDSDTLEVGDLVLAIGNPFGVGQTVTSGIVSALARSRQAQRGGTGVFIQTDAPINPGNSGGALVDMEGRLVGINTAILSRSGGSNGIGFAVPANLVAKVVQAARSGQTALVRPWLGVNARSVDGEIAASLGLDAPKGVLVQALHPDSPLAKAGVKRGDIILKADGAAINTIQEFEFRAATKSLGQSLSVDYLRSSETRSARIRLMAPPTKPAANERTLGNGAGLPGLTIVNVNPEIIDRLNLSVRANGVLVLNARGPARRVGLRRGDFIRSVDGTQTRSVRGTVNALNATAGNTVLEVERDGRVGKIRYRR